MNGRLGLIAVIVCVAAAIVAGLVVSGSPERQRMLRTDETRVSDLQRIMGHVQRYYRESRRLPESLDTLVDGRIAAGIPRDPQTDARYEYEATGRASFELCAEFALESGAVDPRFEFWVHDAGRECYAFDLTNMADFQPGRR